MQGDAINEASAKALADRMIEDSDNLAKMIEDVGFFCPRTVPDEVYDRDGLVVAA